MARVTESALGECEDFGRSYREHEDLLWVDPVFIVVVKVALVRSAYLIETLLLMF